MNQEAVSEKSPLHVALIMDGNGRWANVRNLPRVAGHRRGAETVRRVVEHAPSLGISTLTLYAFSQDNWSRPGTEVRALMELFRHTLITENWHCQREGVRITVIGRRDRLRADLVQTISVVENATAPGKLLHLRIALDYSGRHSIQAGEVGPDVDLLVRTGGEQRLSDFLLWESAYAEILFEPRLWPDFTEADLKRAVAWFRTRNRRFGGLGQCEITNADARNVHHIRGDRWLR